MFARHEGAAAWSLAVKFQSRRRVCLGSLLARFAPSNASRRTRCRCGRLQARSTCQQPETQVEPSAGARRREARDGRRMRTAPAKTPVSAPEPLRGKGERWLNQVAAKSRPSGSQVAHRRPRLGLVALTASCWLLDCQPRVYPSALQLTLSAVPCWAGQGRSCCCEVAVSGLARAEAHEHQTEGGRRPANAAKSSQSAIVRAAWPRTTAGVSRWQGAPLASECGGFVVPRPTPILGGQEFPRINHSRGPGG